MSTISGVQSSSAYLQAVDAVRSLEPAQAADAPQDASANDGARRDLGATSATAQGGLAASRPTDTVGNHIDTFA